MSRVRTLTIPAAAAVAALLLLALGMPVLVGGCRKGGDGAAADSTAAAAADTSAAAEADEEPAKEKAIKVNVGAVRRGDLVLPVYADGAIRTPRSVSVKTKVGGQLQDVKVRDGDRVRKNQLLARIDPREYEIALEEGRYRHLAALSQMAAESDTFSTNPTAAGAFVTERDKLAAALERGELTREEHQAQLLSLEKRALQDGAFREAVFQQRTGLAEARLAEERARLNLEYTEIRAPFDGVVQGLTMVTGEIVGVGTQVCTVFNNDRLEAAVNVLEADLGHLETGRPVLLAVAATNDTLRAKIDVISPHPGRGQPHLRGAGPFHQPRGAPAARHVRPRADRGRGLPRSPAGAEGCDPRARQPSARVQARGRPRALALCGYRAGERPVGRDPRRAQRRQPRGRGGSDRQ
jgi:multidrug efflux pump subunit AcrA (membrane-fusion protein)